MQAINVLGEVVGKHTANTRQTWQGSPVTVQAGQAFGYRQYLGRCDRQTYLVAKRQA